VSDRQGSFELRHLLPGRYALSARHAAHATGFVPELDVRGDRSGLRILLGRTAELRGRVLGIPPERAREVRVAVLGGSAQLRALPVDADGAFRLEGLDPGDYVVCAFLGERTQALEDRIHRLFAEPASGSPLRLALAAGESREISVALELPPAGKVQGRITINGAPPSACRIELQPSDGSRRLWAVPDAGGGFAFAEVPAQDYRLRVTVSSGGRHELHTEDLRVAAEATLRVDRDLACGGLRGQVVASDGTPQAQIAGTVYLLPGASEAPTDLVAHAREHPVLELRVRNGRFAAELLPVGPALAVVQVRGRAPAVSRVEIAASVAREVVFAAGVPQ